MRTTVVVPCFNEEQRWDRSYWMQLAQVIDVDWLFVDDGSRDGTRELLGESANAVGGEVLHLVRNQGKAEAVRHGLLRALPSSEAVGFLDADGAFPATVVSQVYSAFLQRASQSPVDAVWSSRVALAGRSIERHATRHYVGRAIMTFASIGRSQIPYDTQSGFKLFRNSSTLAEVLSTPFETRWLFEFEILDRWVQRCGRQMNIWEEPVLAWRDVDGSHIRGPELVRIGRELALTLQRVRRKQQRS